ncbi:hypothetical protein B0H13DRAFT_1888601 [Mycena leptocephala]|nr:hypothetical protein B0H13DRAFT_1888601 [Mycena leptocephala]
MYAPVPVESPPSVHGQFMAAWFKERDIARSVTGLGYCTIRECVLGQLQIRHSIPHTFPLNWSWGTEEDRRMDHPITFGGIPKSDSDQHNKRRTQANVDVTRWSAGGQSRRTNNVPGNWFHFSNHQYV